METRTDGVAGVVRARFAWIAIVAAVLGAVVSMAVPALGQECGPVPVNTSPIRGGMSGAANFDDRGTGVPRLFVSGRLEGLSPAGGELFRWENGVWSAVASAPSGLEARRLHSGIDAQGPALYVQNPSGDIYRYDGASWTTIPTPTPWGIDQYITSLATFDPDGPGPLPPRLYALLAELLFVGLVSGIQGILVEWDGQAWNEVGGRTVSGSVVVYDRDGDGPLLPELYTVGRRGSWYQPFNEYPLGYVQRFVNNQWITIAELDFPTAAHVHEPGVGQPPLLIVGGSFTELTHGNQTRPMNRIAAWDGEEWRALGSGLPGATGEVQSLATFASGESGQGPLLLAGGTFVRNAGGLIDGLAAWDGQAWSEYAGGIQMQSAFFGGVGIVPFLDESYGQPEPALLASVREGTVAGRPASPVMVLRRGVWEGLFDGPGGPGRVNTLAVLDVGAGPRLIAAGRFERCGEFVANHIASWDGSTWMPLGSGLDAVPANPTPLAFASAVPHDGAGRALYVGGSFRSAGGAPVFNIAKWRGQQWSAVGSGLGGIVHALQVHDPDGSGPAPALLYAGGAFSHSGGSPARKLAAWDGTSWIEVAGGLSGAGAVRALTSHRDGAGSALYVGGDMLSAGGLPENLVFKLVGGGWQAVAPLHTSATWRTNQVHGLAIHDMGSGPRLYAAGSHATGFIGRLDGTVWRGLSTSGVLAPQEAFAVRSVHDCRGAALYVDGLRFDAGGVEMLDPRPTMPVRAISAPVRLGEREMLFIGGDFHELRYRCPGTCDLPRTAARLASVMARECWANCDQSAAAPLLNVDDFVCFISEFNVGMMLPQAEQVGSYANCDGSTSHPVLNIDDFHCFLVSFAAGCP